MRRRRYASDSYDADKERRLRRIRRRACPELKDAYEAGTISLRQFDLVSRGSKAQQRRVVTAERTRSVTATLAAKTINQFLDSLEAGTPLSLLELASAVRNVCSKTGTANHH